MFDLKGKTILLTGAAGYLGKAMGQGLTELGANVIGTSRSYKVRNLGYHDSYVCDFRSISHVSRLLSHVLHMYQIDVLINNAYDLSQQTGFGVEGHLDETHWNNAFDCLMWTVRNMDFVEKDMIKQGSGSIINISSMYSIVSPDPEMYVGTEYANPTTYSVMKAGLNALTKRTAVRLGRYGIRCNAVLPGAFPNDSVTDVPFLEKLCNKSVLGRTGKPEDLLGIIALLASDHSKFITGQEISVDGGWTLV